MTKDLETIGAVIDALKYTMEMLKVKGIGAAHLEPAKQSIEALKAHRESLENPARTPQTTTSKSDYLVIPRKDVPKKPDIAWGDYEGTCEREFAAHLKEHIDYSNKCVALIENAIEFDRKG